MEYFWYICGACDLWMHAFNFWVVC